MHPTDTILNAPTMRCPVCGSRGELVESPTTPGEYVCQSCSGSFLRSQPTARLFHTELRLDLQKLQRDAMAAEGITLRCSECSSRMGGVVMGQIYGHLCGSCGALWLEAGSLYALTGGQHGEDASLELDIPTINDMPANAPAVEAPPVSVPVLGVPPPPNYRPDAEEQGRRRPVAPTRGLSGRSVSVLSPPVLLGVAGLFAASTVVSYLITGLFVPPETQPLIAFLRTHKRPANELPLHLEPLIDRRAPPPSSGRTASARGTPASTTSEQAVRKRRVMNEGSLATYLFGGMTPSEWEDRLNALYNQEDTETRRLYATTKKKAELNGLRVTETRRSAQVNVSPELYDKVGDALGDR